MLIIEGSGEFSLFFDKSRVLSNVSRLISVGIVPENKVDLLVNEYKLVQRPMVVGIVPLS